MLLVFFMENKLIKTVRLNDNESLLLKNVSLDFSKRNVLNGVHKLYKESDLIHFMIEHLTGRLDIDSNGDLIFIEDNR